MSISPAVGRVSPMIILASVVLPDPLSPAMPKMSPCRTLSETSSTARTVPFTRLNTPLRVTKSRLTPFSVTISRGPWWSMVLTLSP